MPGYTPLLVVIIPFLRCYLTGLQIAIIHKAGTVWHAVPAIFATSSMPVTV